jgi:hypothetical protein
MQTQLIRECGGDYLKKLVIKNVSKDVLKLKYRLPSTSFFFMEFPELITISPGGCIHYTYNIHIHAYINTQQQQQQHTYRKNNKKDRLITPTYTYTYTYFAGVRNGGYDPRALSPRSTGGVHRRHRV